MRIDELNFKFYRLMLRPEEFYVLKRFAACVEMHDINEIIESASGHCPAFSRRDVELLDDLFEFLFSYEEEFEEKPDEEFERPEDGVPMDDPVMPPTSAEEDLRNNIPAMGWGREEK